MTVFEFRGKEYQLHTDGSLSAKEEVEAVALIFGRTAKESAQLRGVSPETTKRQRESARYKVGARCQNEFIMILMANGWLTARDTSTDSSSQPMYRRGQLLPRRTLSHYITRIMFAVHRIGRRVPV